METDGNTYDGVSVVEKNDDDDDDGGDDGDNGDDDDGGANVDDGDDNDDDGDNGGCGVNDYSYVYHNFFFKMSKRRVILYKRITDK